MSSPNYLYILFETIALILKTFKADAKSAEAF